MENSLSQRLKELRGRKGFSQELLAEKSGLSLRTIQRIENGETVPRGDTLRRLAVALQVSPDEIIDWQMVEDKNVLLVLNFSQFGFFIFPLLGIIIPLAIWILKKDKVMSVYNIGKEILNFQITWTIAVFLIYIYLIVSKFIFLRMGLSPWLCAMTLITLYAYNAIVVLVNTILSFKSMRTMYPPALNILR